jgi:hypothetical protein
MWRKTMIEKIKCTITCELVELYASRENAIKSLWGWDYGQYIVARNMFPAYNDPWAVYQVITVGNEEVI